MTMRVDVTSVDAALGGAESESERERESECVRERGASNGGFDGWKQEGADLG